MKNSQLNNAIYNMLKDVEENKTDGYTIINVRPGGKINALLDIFCLVTKKTPSAFITEHLSDELAQLAKSSKDNAQAIAQAAQEFPLPSKDSALGILNTDKIYTVKSGFFKDLDL